MKTYQSESFNDVVFKLTELFVTLPPPTPSVQRSSQMLHRSPSSSMYAKPSRALPTVTMQSIMDENNGCILASCQVRLLDEREKKIGELRLGDVLSNGARVRCVILSCYHGPLVQLGSSLVITPYHPVRFNGEWRFPVDLVGDNDIGVMIDRVDCSKNVLVCNLVLEQTHVVNVAGIECVTFAHGFEDNDVVRHSYYGTSRVLDDLMRLDGWGDGFIRLDKFYVRRNPSSGLVEAAYGHVFHSPNYKIQSPILLS